MVFDKRAWRLGVVNRAALGYNALQAVNFGGALMCYCNCEYENCFGGCEKPSRLPCPYDENQVAEYEYAKSVREEERSEAKRVDRAVMT